MLNQDDIEFLREVDARWRVGMIQEDIARELGLGTANGLRLRIAKVGFRLTRRGGLQLVDVLYGRPFREWDHSGELVRLQQQATIPA